MAILETPSKVDRRSIPKLLFLALGKKWHNGGASSSQISLARYVAKDPSLETFQKKKRPNRNWWVALAPTLFYTLNPFWAN
jgi:hypothetical protein